MVKKEKEEKITFGEFVDEHAEKALEKERIQIKKDLDSIGVNNGIWVTINSGSWKRYWKDKGVE